MGTYVPYADVLDFVDGIKSTGKSFRDVANIPAWAMFVGCRGDARMSRPSKNTNEKMAFETKRGLVRKTPQDYCEDLAKVLKPAAAISFAKTLAVVTIARSSLRGVRLRGSMLHQRHGGERCRSDDTSRRSSWWYQSKAAPRTR